MARWPQSCVLWGDQRLAERHMDKHEVSPSHAPALPGKGLCGGGNGERREEVTPRGRYLGLTRAYFTHLQKGKQALS